MEKSVLFSIKLKAKLSQELLYIEKEFLIIKISTKNIFLIIICVRFSFLFRYLIYDILFSSFSFCQAST